jgi:flagellar basal-body rod modification protein FlgD
MSNINAAAAATENVLASLARKEPEKKDEDAQNRFLTLLTTQLRNQDPMNPMDNAQMTSQLAQISTVQGIEKLGKLFEQMMAGQASTEAMQAAALVGRGVLVEGRSLILTEAGAVGGFDLSEPADQVLVSIKDANGIEVAKVDLGSAEAGVQNFVWDGTTSNGQRAADGQYSLSVSATRGEEAVSVQSLQYGLVTGAMKGTKSTDLQVGSLGIFAFDKIKQIL